MSFFFRNFEDTDIAWRQSHLEVTARQCGTFRRGFLTKKSTDVVLCPVQKLTFVRAQVSYCTLQNAVNCIFFRQKTCKCAFFFVTLCR